MTPMSHQVSLPARLPARIVVFFLVLVLVTGIFFARQGRARTSAVIVEQWPAIDATHWLKADLADALVVVPDRPHGRDEVQDHWSGFHTDIRRARSFRVRTNAQRLRGGPIGPKTRKRVIALGDSVTHGWGVGEAQAWPARLEAHLAAAGSDVQVLNAGVPASRVGGMASWCETQAPALEPDLIIWARRPGFDDPRPYNKFVDAVRRCGRATGSPVLVVLPPISTFDLHGERV